MTHRANIKATALRHDPLGREQMVMRALISILSVVIILGTQLSEGIAIG